MGTGNQYQLKQLNRLGVTEFVLCLDGDEAGWKATDKLKKALKGTAIVWTVHVPEGKDVNDLSEQEFLEVYENRD
jgi:DNA primase